MRASRESDVLRACLDLLKWKGIMAWRSNNTGVFDPVKKRFRAFQGLKGVSDILGLISADKFYPPLKTHGVFLAVETKGPNAQDNRI